MIVNPASDRDADPEDAISEADAALYIYELCREMSGMARRARFEALAALLEQARVAAADALIETRRWR